MADYTSTNNSEPRGAVDRGESADDWIQPATRYRLRNIFITSLAVIKSSLGELGLGSHDDLVTFTAAEVSGAKDGVEAMELLGHSRFDLVLSDLRMPGMDGLTLASHIVSSDPTTPILLMTAYYFDNRADILQLGVPFLRKPFSPNELLSEIQKVIGEAKADY